MNRLLIVAISVLGLISCDSKPKTEVVQTATDNPVSSQENYQEKKSNKGEALFKMQCASCHDLNKKVIGPALKGVTDKYEEEWLISFIKNSKQMIESGDKRAVAVFNENQKQPMLAFEFLADDEIKAILAYIKEH